VPELTFTTPTVTDEELWLVHTQLSAALATEPDEDEGDEQEGEA
jgi:hypothetical protein